MATFNSFPALAIRPPSISDGSGNAMRMMNMMAQQQAAQRQTAQAQQSMDIAAAQEARAARLAGPQYDKATYEAQKAFIATASDFNNFVRVASDYAETPQQARDIAARIAALPQFQAPIFQQSIETALQNLPDDPALFPKWKDSIAYQTLDSDQKLSQELKDITTGSETFTMAIPKYRGSNVAPSEVPGTRQKAPEGITYIKTDQGIIPMPSKTSGGAPGAPALSGDGYDVAYGNMATPKPLTGMTLGEVQNFQKNTLIPATRGKVGAGPDKGTGAVGRYQIVYGTLQKYAPKVLGANWQSMPFDAAAQEKLGRAIYEDAKDGDLSLVWAGMPKNAPGAYSNVPWEDVRDKIAGVESSGGGIQMGKPLPGSKPKTPASTESERRFGTISKQMITNLGELTNILKSNPDAIQPSGMEYAASQLPVYGEEASLFAQSEPRQQFVAAALRFLDNVTYVNTGAGTSRTQEENYRRSYIPTYQDSRASAYRKLSNMVSFAKNVKAAAGVLWTPEMDTQLSALRRAVDTLKPKTKGAGGTAAPKAPASSGWGPAKVVGD